MDRLPVELIRMIFSLLRLTDVGHLRRVSKLFANAGRSRLFHHLHLMFTPHSFERLHAISSNPELAPYVTSMFYEADTLPVYGRLRDWEQELIDRRFDWEQLLKNSKFEWEQHLLDSEFDSNSESENSSCPSHSSDSSDRAERIYQRKLSQLENLKSSRYQKFVNYSKQQDAMRKDNYYAGKIADAMLHLINLEHIDFSLEQWGGRRTKAMKSAYQDSLIVPHGHNSWREPFGVPQMLSLLQGSACTQKKLKCIRGGVMDWKFWKQTDEVFKDLQLAVQYVQELELEFSATPDAEAALDLINLFGVEKLELEIRECAEYLKNRRLEAFVTAAPNLRRLDLRFRSFIPSKIRSFPADLSYVVGNHVWDFLADVTLSFFSSRAEDLIGFCESHATTLKRLIISRIKLVEGSWLSTFQTMRRLLHLQQVSIHGRLEAVDECWDFVTIDFPGETTMGRVVQEYILQGGDGPLLDPKPYIMLNQVELEELKDGFRFYMGR